MARVFISHAGGDAEPAAEVQRWLVEDGHEVFLDRDPRDGIRVGDEWERRLHERLRWSDAVVCVVTSAYLRSVWCAAEVGAARSRGSRVLPVLAEPGVVHPLLDPVQHTDMARDPAAARRALSEALLRIDASGGAGWPDGASPFPGLVPFDTTLRRVFFGRSDEIGRFLELLRSPAERAEGGVHLVVGPSGSGKSSLVRAGLVPAVAEEPEWWVVPPFVPGTDPVGALARSVAATARQVGLDWTVAHVRALLDGSGLVEPADEILLAAPGGARRLLVVADQLEELLTQTAASDRARFAELVRGALTGPVLVVATLRSEFLDQLLTQPELAELRPRLHPVRPLRRQALRAVVEGPARVAGIRVEGELVDRLVADTDSGAALPLLAFALAELADGVGRGDELSAARYDRLGGVRGALTRQADAALAAAVRVADRSPDDVLAGLLRLVTVDEQGNPTRWRVERAELPGTVAAELDEFVARRLLVTDTGDGGSAVITVAHEAFLTAWPPLRDAIDAEASALRARRAVEHGAAEWDRSGRPDERLWERGQLAAAVADTGARVVPDGAPSGRRAGAIPLLRRHVVVTDRVPVSATARDFLVASIRRDRLRRGRATTILSVLCALALVAAGVAFVQQRAAQEQQRVATARQLGAQADLLRDSDPQTALMLDIAAERIHSDGDTRAALVGGVLSSPYAGTLAAHAGSSGGEGPVFSADGRLMATVGGWSEHTVILWDVSGDRPRQLGPPLRIDGRFRGLGGFSPDGRILATTSDNEVVLWDVRAPAAPRAVGRPIPAPEGLLVELRYSADGRTLAVAATAGSPSTVELWDISDPAEARRRGERLVLGPLLGLVEFHPTGTALIIATSEAGEPGEVVVWDIADPADPRPVGSPLRTGGEAAFHPGTGLLATDTDSSDHSIVMWDLTDPATPRQLPGGAPPAPAPRSAEVLDVDPPVDLLEFASDGAALAGVVEPSPGTRELVVWDAATGWAQPRHLSFGDEEGFIADVAFTPDHSALAAVNGIDGGVTLWDLSDPAQVLPIGPPLSDGAFGWDTAALLPNGRAVLTSRPDGGVTVWDVNGPGRPRRIGVPGTGRVTSLAFFPGPDAVTVGHDDGSVEQHTVRGATTSGPARPLRAGSSSGESGITVLAPRSGIAAATEPDGSIVVVDLQDGTRTGRISLPLSGEPGFGAWPVGFSPDGVILAVAAPSWAEQAYLMTLWEVSDPLHPRSVGAPIRLGFPVAAFAPGRPLLVVQVDSGHGMGFQLIDISDPARPDPIGDPLSGPAAVPSALAFSSDGQVLAVGHVDGRVALWDVTDPFHPRPQGLPLAGHSDGVISLALSPDGRTLVSSGLWEVRLWDLTDRDRPSLLSQLLVGEDEGASALVFSPDGNTLVTGGTGGAVTWDLSALNALREAPRRAACDRTGRGLDPAEWELYVGELEYQDTCGG